ncbi:MAG TPA: nucleoside 2-deoxyribosyltransferase [Bacteroidetes bacterium]|nr:nucleoside 2-deoxyribosyltransferase [Bacteroidota bacterium]
MKKNEPDYQRLRTALYCGQPDRVPLLELHIDPSIQEKFLGRPVRTVAGTVDFYIQAGYDAIRVYPLIDMNPGKFQPKDGKRHTEATDEDRERNWFSEGKGIITNMEEFEKYRWPKPDDVDYRPIEEYAAAIPDSMKLIGQYGDIFTWVWEIMGFETFSYALYENPELIRLMFDRVGGIVYNLFENMVNMDKMGALWYSDDLAFQNGLFTKPEVFRRHLFPWMKRIGDLCRQYNIPFIYHSDGNLWEVMDDIIACGVNALQPIEPQAMDIVAVKEKVKGKMCIAGNMDLEYLLTRAPAGEVAEKTRELLQKVAPGGGYCMGSANTVPNYVKIENYRAMVETTLKFGWYPITL